jgi:hypothetical protein
MTVIYETSSGHFLISVPKDSYRGYSRMQLVGSTTTLEAAYAVARLLGDLTPTYQLAKVRT